MISIRFQPHGPINSDGLVVNPAASALIMTHADAETAFAERIVGALQDIYRDGYDAGLFIELVVHSES